MTFSKHRILIKNLRLLKGYTARKLKKNFQEKAKISDLSIGSMSLTETWAGVIPANTPRNVIDETVD